MNKKFWYYRQPPSYCTNCEKLVVVCRDENPNRVYFIKEFLPVELSICDALLIDCADPLAVARDLLDGGRSLGNANGLITDYSIATCKLKGLKEAH